MIAPTSWHVHKWPHDWTAFALIPQDLHSWLDRRNFARPFCSRTYSSKSPGVGMMIRFWGILELSLFLILWS